jgi:hypothetical protein
MDINKDKFLSPLLQQYVLLLRHYTNAFWHPVRTLDDFARGAANGVTIGQADKAAGIVNAVTQGGSIGRRIAEETEKTAEARQRGLAVTGGELAGSVALAALGGKALAIGEDLAGMRTVKDIIQSARALDAPKLEQIGQEAVGLYGQRITLKGTASVALGTTSLFFSEHSVAASETQLQPLSPPLTPGATPRDKEPQR